MTTKTEIRIDPSAWVEAERLRRWLKILRRALRRLPIEQLEWVVAVLEPILIAQAEKAAEEYFAYLSELNSINGANTDEIELQIRNKKLRTLLEHRRITEEFRHLFRGLL